MAGLIGWLPTRRPSDRVDSATDELATRGSHAELMHDLAIIVVSTNEANWLMPVPLECFRACGTDHPSGRRRRQRVDRWNRKLVEEEFPEVEVVTCSNRGFSHANNRGIMTTDARYVLLLNPDTEMLAGSFADLVADLDERPVVGAVGVKQMTADGDPSPSVRRFPNALRAWAEALVGERWSTCRAPAWRARARPVAL